MIVNVAGLLACNALFFAAGAGVVRLLGGWKTRSGLVRWSGVCYLAGVAVFGVTMQLLLVLGAPFSRSVVVAVCGCFALSGLLARRPADPPQLAERVPRYLLPAVVAIVAIVALMAVDLWFQPLGSWDAWAQWTAKAKALVLFRGIDVDMFSSVAYQSWNPDYPLLLPSVEAADFSFMRQFDTRAIHAQFWLLYAGFLLTLVQLLRGRVRETLVWPFVLCVAVAPSVHVQTASAIADVPVGIFFAVAGILAWRWLVDRDRVALRVYVLFAAGALATKFEGRITVGALSVTLIVLLLVSDRRRLPPALLAVAVSLVGVVPITLWGRQHQVTGIFSTSVSDRVDAQLPSKLERVPVILHDLGLNVADPARWLVLGPVIVAVIAIGLATLPRRVEPWFVVGTLAVATAGIGLAYVASPFEVHAYLDQSARRVVTGPMFFGVALAPLLLEAVLRARARRRVGSEYPLGP